MEELREFLAQQQAALDGSGAASARLLRYSLPLFQHMQRNFRVCRVLLGSHSGAIGEPHMRRILTDWLSDMKLRPAIPEGGLDRYIGYYEPYATSHDALDKDTAVQQEVRATARARVDAVTLSLAGKLPPLELESELRPK